MIINYVIKRCNSFGGNIVNVTLCYQASTSELTFVQANNFCEQRGGRLWVPNDERSYARMHIPLLIGYGRLYIGIGIG
ncbi:hypothetical protein Avbf_11227 [Armadillidium vulgare]|nr:hypothetical protein Avbf_11227 [Armadillidium vulgare]